MITSIVCIALIGTHQFNYAISAAINYEPIKVTVNENFNAQSGQVSPDLQKPGVLHQGANFYFKPQLKLPPSYILSHIEGLISLIQQHHHSSLKDASKVVFEKDKLIEILKPFMYPMSEISKETLSEFVLEKENSLEIVKPIIVTEELKPVTTELLIIPEAPELPPPSFNGIPPIVEEEVKKEESVILEESTGVFPRIPEIAMRPIPEPIITYVEPKPLTSGLVVIPEALMLPPLSANDTHVVEEEFKIKESIVVDVEPKPIIQELVTIPEAPLLPSLSLQDISSMIEEEVKKEELVIFDKLTRVFPTIPKIDVRPTEEPIIEPKSITSDLVVIPEATVLPALSFNGIPPIVEKEESIILEAPTGVFPKIPEIDVKPITKPIINYVESEPMNAEHLVIPEAPVLAPLSANDTHVVEEDFKIKESIVVDVEPKPIIQELVTIPEAPLLPSLSLQDISSMIEEEVKKEELVIFDKLTRVFPTIPKIDARPTEEPIIEPKSITSDLVVIPEATVLPALSFNGIPHIVEKEESIILEAPTGAFPKIPEIDVRSITKPIINYVKSKPMNAEHLVIPEAPVLAPLSANDTHVVEEEFKIKESIVVDVEPKPIIQELVTIPEAPLLPSLSLQDISSMIEEEVKKEELVIFDKLTRVFPTILKIDVRPTEEPIIEPKSITSDLVVIPEATVLPALSFNGIPPIVEKEESIILEAPTGVFPKIPEIDVRPITKPIINYVESKHMNVEHLVIPEAPVLAPLSANDIHVVDKEVKIEEPIVVDVEPKLAIQELVAIPEAPVLPSHSLHNISSIIEEKVKKEESVIFEEPTGVFPSFPETSARPEAVKVDVEPKPAVEELFVIPEAPVLAPLSANDIHVVEEDVKIEEPIVVDVEPKPAIQELVAIPESPVLSSLSHHDISSIIEEEKKEKSVIFEEPTAVFPSIPEISASPETVIVNVKPKPAVEELLVIPEDSVLPVRSDIPVVQKIKLEESAPFSEVSVRPIDPEPIITDVEHRPITPGCVVILEPPVLPQLSHNGLHPVVEDVKIEESIKFEESTGVFPSISEISARPFTKPLVESETAESFALENNIFSNATEEVKIEVPILQESEITEVSQLNPESVVTIKEKLPPKIIPKPSNNMGVFSYVPFVSHLSNRAPKAKKLMIPKSTSVERFLLKKYPFRLPVTPFPKLDLNAVKSSIWGNKKRFYISRPTHMMLLKNVLPQKWRLQNRMVPNV